LWQKVAASAIAVLLIPLAVVALRPGGLRHDPAAGPAAAAASAPGIVAASAPAAPASAAIDPDVLPAGLEWWDDRSGFRVAVPVGWLHVREGPVAMLFCERGGPLTLRVRAWDRSDEELTAGLLRDETQSALAGYRRIRIEVLPDGDGAEWEYTFDGPMGRLRGLDRVFTVLGRRYLVQWRTPPSTWQAHLASFGTIVNSFKPPHRLAAVAE
jgi:hypothetical protein